MHKAHLFAISFFFPSTSEALHGSEKWGFLKLNTDEVFSPEQGVKLAWVCVNPTSENQLAAL